jgi:hypothetical protein
LVKLCWAHKTYNFHYLTYIYIEENQCIDDIATLELQIQEFQWWDTIHNSISHAFTRNIFGCLDIYRFWYSFLEYCILFFSHLIFPTDFTGKVFNNAVVFVRLYFGIGLVPQVLLYIFFSLFNNFVSSQPDQRKLLLLAYRLLTSPTSLSFYSYVLK